MRANKQRERDPADGGDGVTDDRSGIRSKGVAESLGEACGSNKPIGKHRHADRVVNLTGAE